MTHGVGREKNVMMCVNWRWRGFCTICGYYHDERGVPFGKGMFTNMFALREELRKGM